MSSPLDSTAAEISATCIYLQAMTGFDKPAGMTDETYVEGVRHMFRFKASLATIEAVHRRRIDAIDARFHRFLTWWSVVMVAILLNAWYWQNVWASIAGVAINGYWAVGAFMRYRGLRRRSREVHELRAKDLEP